MNLLIIDNHDSFTYNLVQLFKELGAPINVIKNDDQALLNDIEFHKAVLSPGPGLPAEAGHLMPFIEKYFSSKSILGVCLGHQALAEYFGAKIVKDNRVKHGISSRTKILNTDNLLFKGISSPFYSGRYHSWYASQKDFPESLEITSLSEDGIIMSFSHKILPIHGVQFHPESIMSLENGKVLLRNWLES